MTRRRVLLYTPPPPSRRARRLRLDLRGATLDFRPHETAPNLRLPSGDRAYCGNCARHWQDGAWFWDLPINGPGGRWRCALCCVLASNEVECDCCGLPREVNAALMARGCWP